jgi:hypothetical protein
MKGVIPSYLHLHDARARHMQTMLQRSKIGDCRGQLVCIVVDPEPREFILYQVPRCEKLPISFRLVGSAFQPLELGPTNDSHTRLGR